MNPTDPQITQINADPEKEMRGTLRGNEMAQIRKAPQG